MSSGLRIGLITKEWPPQVYGGAGVHVVQLSQALRNQPNIEVDVHCFGGPRNDANGYNTPAGFENSNAALQALATDLAIADNLSGVDVIHSHTWYANFAGFTANLLHGIPHVVSSHSLEPLRPWKAEQLGGGYQISSWLERISYESADAIIAVSQGMKRDILRAYPSLNPSKIFPILNGIDTKKYTPMFNENVLTERGISGRYALFVGRITRQKGLAHLLRAWKIANPDIGLVIAAGSPDEPGIGQEIAALIKELQTDRSNIWWFEKMLPQSELITLLTHADFFICPSIYEPLGIVNLEAMACETAVLASDVGGIPEVVIDHETGELVHYPSALDRDATSRDDEFEAALASKIRHFSQHPELLEKYGKAGRKRAIAEFSWQTIASQTITLYSDLISQSKRKNIRE